MKLRNKKTGEVFEAFRKAPIDLYFYLNKYEEGENDFDRKTYQSLAELNEEWEDYKPKEPLIKQEKIRKAVRAWAEACRLTHVTYKLASNEFYDADTRGKFAIKFTLMPIEVYLKDGESYTIAELCGEEEE